MGAEVVRPKPSQESVDTTVKDQKAKGYLSDADIKTLSTDTEEAMRFLTLTANKGKTIDDQKSRGILDAKTETAIRAMKPENAITSLNVNEKMHSPNNLKYLTPLQKESLAKMTPDNALAWLNLNQDKYQAIRDAINSKLILPPLNFATYASGDPQNTIDELKMLKESSEAGDKKKAEIDLDNALKQV